MSVSLLATGESLREDPRTILLSFPVLAFAVVLYYFSENRPALASALGHLALSFRLFYKHHLRLKILLLIAYQLLSESAGIGAGDGQPTVRMVMGTIATEFGNLDQGESDFITGIKMASDINDKNQTAFIESHLGRLLVQKGELQKAKKHLDNAYKVLSLFVKNASDQRPHIWISNTELGLSEYYLAVRDKEKAKHWADQAKSRADKYKLETRKLDVKKLMSQITQALPALLLSWLRFS